MPPNELKGYLLSIIEQGGYPNFLPLYQEIGYEVDIVRSVRKASNAIRQRIPDVIIAEFNFQSDFRDRTSSLESLLAVVQQYCPESKVIIFFEQEYGHQFDKIRSRFPVHTALPFPINESALRAALAQILAINQEKSR